MSDPRSGSLAPAQVYRRPKERGNAVLTAVFLLIAVVILYVGAGILVPLVLAVLLAFALTPLIRRFRRLHIPHIVAVLMAVLLAASLLSTIGYVVATQLIKLSSELPRYQATVTEKTLSLQESFGGGAFVENLFGALDQLQGQFGDGSGPGAARPMPVTITNGGTGPLDVVQTVLGSVLGPLATAAIVLVFLIFLLLEREDLRDRFLKLVSRGDLRTSTQVMNEAAARVARYLIVQFCVNLSYGFVFGLGLWIIGVPNAVLWGLLAAMFRYIPFVGTIIAATIPFTLAFAVDPGWSMLLSAVALYVTLELVITNAIEPRLYGSSTGLSALAVLIAAMFWATLWGPIGLILSTPITVCLVVLGRYVPQLGFFETLLGSGSVMAPPERLYQRLVSGNVEEAVELADDYVADHDVSAFYQGVAMPALALAEADLSHDATDLSHRRNVVESLNAVIEDMDADSEQVIGGPDAHIMCIGGRTELDEAAAHILQRVLAADGIDARAAAPLLIRQESIGQLDLDHIRVVCLCYLGANPRSYVRFVAKRLARRYPDIKVLVCLFNPATPLPERAQEWGVARIVRTLGEAARAIGEELGEAQIVTQPLEQPMDPAAMARLRKLSRADGHLAGVLAEIARVSGVPVAVLDIAGARDGEAESDTQGAPGINRPSQRVMESREAIIIEDAAANPDFGNDAFLLENGVRFYAGVPLFGPDGGIVGVLALLDHEPKLFSTADREKLELQALKLMVSLSELKASAA